MKHQRSSVQDASARSADFVSSLAKGLEILAAFDRGEVLGNQDLVHRTGMPKATVSRLTGTLAVLGYLFHDEQTRKYAIGARLLGISASVQRHLGLQRAARPLMETLAKRVDTTVLLGTRDRHSIVFLEVVRPQQSRLVVNSDAGTLVPLETTAIGKAYLVVASVAERVRILEGVRRRRPDDWDSLRRGIEQAHSEYRKRGFVTSCNPGNSVNGVAVPLVLKDARSAFSFGCAGPAKQLGRARLTEELGPHLLQMVAQIQDQLSGTLTSRTGIK